MLDDTTVFVRPGDGLRGIFNHGVMAEDAGFLPNPLLDRHVDSCDEGSSG
jgi:hypothetical protein